MSRSREVAKGNRKSLEITCSVGFWAITRLDITKIETEEEEKNEPISRSIYGRELLSLLT